MMGKTHATILFVIAYILGIIAYFKSFEIIFATVLLVIIFILLYKKLIREFLALSLFSAFLFGIFYSDYKIQDSDILTDLAYKDVSVKARVISIPPTTYSDRSKFFLSVSEVEEANNTYKNVKAKTFVTVYDTTENYSKINIGDIIKVKGKLRIPQNATNPSQFSYRSYLRNFNTFTTLYVNAEDWKILEQPQDIKWKFIQKLNLVRKDILSKHAQNIKSPNLEVLGGVVFGDDAISPPEDVKQSFINSGLLHILAASGLNVALIFGIWFFILNKLKMPYRFRILSGIFIIIFYTLMTGLGSPVLRASLMLIFALIGKLIDRKADNIALLMFVAFLLLLFNPAWVFDVGFQLSFIVTLILLIACPIMAEKTKKIPQSIAGAIYLPILAQISVAPIQIFYFNTFASYSIFANILSIPLISIISFLGFGSSILGLIPFISNKVIFVSDFILNHVISWLLWVSNFFASLPNSLITTTQCNVVQIVLYYTIFFLLLYIIKNKFSKPVLIAFLVAIIGFSFTFIKIDKKNLEVIFFDMGNADSILIKTPNRKYFIIDTGKIPFKSGLSQAKAIVYEYLKDRGIKNIESIIVTHYDADHAGGTIDLLDNLHVKNLVIKPVSDRISLSKSIFEEGKKVSSNIIFAKNNEFLYEKNQTKIKTFVIESKNLDENDTSIVTVISQGDKNIIFMGDGGVKTFNELEKVLPKQAEIIKIGHHGGKNTINDEMIKNLKIKTAIISTGLNYFGHPNSDTIATLQKNQINYKRTDSDNAIKAEITRENKVNIYTYNIKTKKWKKNI